MSVGSSIIGALRVVFGADTAQLDTALKDSSGKLKTFGATAVTIGNLASDAIKGAANAIADSFRQAIDQANKVSNLSRSLGVAVEQLSALKYAAASTGVSLDQLGEGLKTLQARMVEALADNRSDPARAFAAIGMSAKDLQRTASDVFLDLANKFQSFANGPAKTALADAFGIGSLLPLLDKGKDGIKQFMAEAQRLGIVMTTQGAAGAEEFRRTLDRLDTQQKSFAETVSLNVLPGLTLLAQHFEKTDSSGKAWGETIGNVMNRTLKEFLFLVEQSGPAWSSLMNGLRGNPQAAKDAALGLQAMRDAMLAFKGAPDMMTESGLPLAFNAIQKAMAPVPETARQLAERMAAIRAELTTMVSGPSQDFAGKMFAISEAFKKGNITLRDEITLSAQVAQLAIAAQKAALMDLINTPTETFEAKLRAVNAAVADGTVIQREFAQLTKKINDENIANWQAMGGAVSSTLTSIFKDSKAAAIGAALINTATAVTKNLATYPWPFGAVMAGLAAAAGAAQIAAIRSTNLSGSGGATARAGSAPSVSTAAAAQSAQSAAPASSGPAAAAAPPGQTLTVTGIDPRSLFSGEAVRRLAELLVQHQKNGGTVVFANR